jgi:hypothetical protein
MRLLTRVLSASVSVLALSISAAHAASPACTAPETKLTWPATGQPIWEMCWLAPNQSSGPEGSGLEIRKAYFRGVPVLKRAHSPMLFAEYRTDQGANGNCYRDWMDENSGIAAEPQVRGVLGTPVDFFATTNCDVSTTATQAFGNCPFNGNPVRPFTNANCNNGGVALENGPRGNYVQLTAQYSAGWYKYSSRIRFYDSGAIEKEFGLGNSTGTYNNATHWHHNYWRLDFDLNGPAGDQLFVNDVLQNNEFALKRKDGATTNTFKIVDQATGFGYRFEPGASDDISPANQSNRGFHSFDMFGTLYKANEIADTATWSLSDCRMRSENLVNVSESITNADTVFYYRAGVRDSTANDAQFPGVGPGPTGQDSMICKRVGPGIIPIGDWPLFRGDFEIGT